MKLKQHPQHRPIQAAVFTLMILSIQHASGFELGEPDYLNIAGKFEVRIPVKGLDRDGSSALAGTIYSRNDIVDEFQYRVESSGDLLEFIATAKRQLSEPLTFRVEMDYRGDQASRRYDYQLSATSAAKVNFSLTPTANNSARKNSKFDLSLAHTTHTVKKGQTLWDIAVDCGEIGGNNFQRSLAIFAANQDKFRNGNINRLHTETTLVIPKQSYVYTFDASEAESIFYKIATGKLAFDANKMQKPGTVETTAVQSTVVSESIAMHTSKDVPTEQVIMARRISMLESELKALGDRLKAIEQQQQ